MDQFLESLHYSEQLEESYLSGSRLIKFLSSSLPTHRRFYSKDPLLSKLRIKSRNDLAQLGILVEEVALKIDKNIYEDCLWGNAPEFKTEGFQVEPSLHPLIFDDDHSSRRSSKKVTFSLVKSSGNTTGHDPYKKSVLHDGFCSSDVNISSSSSTSTTDFSECSLSSPELVRHSQQDASSSSSSSRPEWFDENIELKIQRKDMAWNQGFGPTNNDDFTLGSSDNIMMSSQIAWGAGNMTIGTAHVSDESEFKALKENWGKRAPKRIGLKSSVNLDEAFQQRSKHQAHKGKVHHSIESNAKGHTIVNGRPVLKQASTWDSCEDEELDHAVYVQQLTQLEFNLKESPIRNKVPRRTCLPVSSHDDKAKTKDPSWRGQQSMKDEKDDHTTASPVTIIHTPIRDNAKDKASSGVQTDHLLNEFEDDGEEILSDDIFVLGIARRDDPITQDATLHVEHIQYLKDRLLQDEPEANEHSWGKNWLKHCPLKLSMHSPSHAQADDPQGDAILTRDKKKSTLALSKDENLQIPPMTESRRSIEQSFDNNYNLKYIPAVGLLSRKSHQNALEGREEQYGYDQGDFHAPDDELISSYALRNAKVSR